MKEKDLFLKSPIKWAGGKSKLMTKIEEVYNKDFIWFPENYTYIEEPSSYKIYGKRENSAYYATIINERKTKRTLKRKSYKRCHTV